MKFFIVVAIVLLALVLLVWLGLSIRPAAFPSFPQVSSVGETLPLPAGLPAPVERFYRQVYGEQIPVIKSVVMTGRAEIRPVGNITFPARFRFTHEAGQNYRHYIEATFFGLPVMKVNEQYIDRAAWGSLPFGTVEGPHTDQAANLGMWAELSWTPAVFLTDARVRWVAVDDETALLVVPFEDGQQTFVVRFDPQSGMLRYMEAMRYRDEQMTQKVLWLAESVSYAELNGTPVAVSGSATWLDQGRPWAVFHVEELAINVDVSKTLRAKGLE